MSKIVVNNLLGEYANGNYKVSIYEDGTKIRETFDENAISFIPSKPECMDVKICNRCDKGCPWCHEDSRVDGELGDILNVKFWETLNPYTEIALGGGNTLEHPDLKALLIKLKGLKLIPNMTVNQTHFMSNLDFIHSLVDEKLIYGLGISLVEVTDEFLSAVSEFPNAVIHIINGIVTVSDLKKMFDKDLKILILGYKNFRRGETYFNSEVVQNKQKMYGLLPVILQKFKVVSFDNLAIEQLNVKRLLSDEEWNHFYMGDDGSFTMYIDLVKQEFAVSSTSVQRFKLQDDIKDMFEIVRKTSNH